MLMASLESFRVVVDHEGGEYPQSIKNIPNLERKVIDLQQDKSCDFRYSILFERHTYVRLDLGTRMNADPRNLDDISLEYLR